MKKEEIWKVVPDTEDMWEASNYGNFRNKKDIAMRNNKKIEKNTIVIKKYDKKRRCNTVSLYINGDAKYFTVRKIILELFSDNDNNFNMIEHIDGDTKNDCFSNLKYRKNNTNIENKKHIEEILSICEKQDLEFVGINRKDYKRPRVEFICNKHKYKGVQNKDLSHFKNMVQPCLFCCGKYTLTTDDLRYHHNVSEDICILGEYKNAYTKIECFCLVCGNLWSAKPNSLKNGRGCPECGKKGRRFSKYEIERKVRTINPSILIVESSYNLKDEAKCFCLIHKKYFTVKLYNLLNGDAGCPYCNRSAGENKVALWLSDKGVEYEREKTFHDLQYKNKLRFDFYLKDYNMLIEYQGEQHYEAVHFGDSIESATQKFHDNKKRDSIKRKYCLKNNIALVEIPYWEKDNLDTVLSKLF